MIAASVVAKVDRADRDACVTVDAAVWINLDNFR